MAENTPVPVPVIGIDLGTTYSCVGVWKDERVEIIPNDQGNRTTPSCVTFTSTERLIGDAAKNQIYTNIRNTVFGELSKTSGFFYVKKLFVWMMRNSGKNYIYFTKKIIIKPPFYFICSMIAL